MIKRKIFSFGERFFFLTSFSSPALFLPSLRFGLLFGAAIRMLISFCLTERYNIIVLSPRGVVAKSALPALSSAPLECSKPDVEMNSLYSLKFSMCYLSCQSFKGLMNASAMKFFLSVMSFVRGQPNEAYWVSGIF